MVLWDQGSATGNQAFVTNLFLPKEFLVALSRAPLPVRRIYENTLKLLKKANL
jgi:hypothetical protein